MKALLSLFICIILLFPTIKIGIAVFKHDQPKYLFICILLSELGLI